MVNVPFVVQVTPRLLSGGELEHDAPYGPDVHHTVLTSCVVFDDLRRHVHWGARKATAQADAEPATEEAVCRTTRPHHRTMVLCKYLRCSEVYELYHAEMIQ